MTNEPLSQNRVRHLLDYDPVTGTLIWKNPTSARVAEGGQAGVLASNGRRYVNIDNKRYLAHRLIWFYTHGQWPSVNLSAKNNDYDDLRLENYVELTAGETARRGGVRSTGKSGIRGVSWDKEKKKWMAHITKDYRSITVGRFHTKEEAQAARERAEQEHGLTPSVASADRARLAERVLRNARLRVEWRKIAGGAVDWKTFDDFAADIGSAPPGRMVLVPVDPEKTLGPNNWAWVQSSKWDHKTAEGRQAYQKQHRDRHRNTYRDKALRKVFGIRYADYEKMLAEHNNVCGCCGRPETAVRNGKVRLLAVDHCHTTGDIRGLLCTHCNSGLGWFRDDEAYLQKAIDYLLRYRAAKSTSVPASHSSPSPMQRKEHSP